MACFITALPYNSVDCDVTCLIMFNNHSLIFPSHLIMGELVHSVVIVTFLCSFILHINVIFVNLMFIGPCIILIVE